MPAFPVLSVPPLTLSYPSQGTLPPALSSYAPIKLSTFPTPFSVAAPLLCSSALLLLVHSASTHTLVAAVLFLFLIFQVLLSLAAPLLFSSAQLLPMHFASSYILFAAVLFLLSIFHVHLSFAALLPCSPDLLPPMQSASTHTLFVPTCFVSVPTFFIF